MNICVCIPIKLSTTIHQRDLSLFSFFYYNKSCFFFFSSDPNSHFCIAAGQLSHSVQLGFIGINQSFIFFFSFLRVNLMGFCNSFNFDSMKTKHVEFCFNFYNLCFANIYVNCMIVFTLACRLLL